MNPLISIVVPVYNVSKYLRKCLDSILAQAYTNWECILVDDGSTDDSGQICEDFNKIDRRFRVLHKSNQGVSAARNTGIKESTGEWLYFCDADDEMLSDGLRTLVHLTNLGEDIVFGGYVECNEEGNPIASPRISVQMKLTKDETIIELYQPSYSHYEGYLWCKLFKTEVIKKNNLFFKEDIYFNEEELPLLKEVVDNSKNFTFKSNLINDSKHYYEIYYKDTKMSIGVYSFSRKNEYIILKDYHLKRNKLLVDEIMLTKEYSKIVIDIIPAENIYGNFINIKNNERYYHIYFNDDKDETKRNEIINPLSSSDIVYIPI